MIATLRLGLLFGLALLASLGVGQSDQFARLDQQNAENWSVVLAHFPKLSDSQQITVLQGLKGFIGKGQKGHLPDGETYDFLPPLALQRKLLGLPEIERSKGVGYMQQAKAIGELASNAFAYALSKGSAKVRPTAVEVAEELLPDYYQPLAIGGHCGTGYDYLMGNFRGGFSDSMRTFAGKNLAWVETVDPREEVEAAKHLLRVHLKLPSAKLGIIKGLASGDEDTINETLFRVMQWPDPEFVPYLRTLIVVEDSQVRPFWSLTEAVMAYREGASAVIDPVLGKVNGRDYWMNELANFGCRESWEYCLTLAQSSEAWEKELGVANIKAMAQGFWLPNDGPKTGVPKDAMLIANRIVQKSLSDSADGVRAAAVKAHDWKGQTELLLKFADDKSAKVRDAFASYLSELPTDIKLKYIWKLAGDSSLRVQSVVGCEIDQDVDRGLEEMARKAVTSRTHRDRAGAAVVLASLGFESDVLPLLKDRNAHVRASALQSLMDYRAIGSDEFLSLCGDEDSAVVRLAVNAMLIRMEDRKDELAILDKCLALVKPQNAYLIHRHIERIKKSLEEDGDK